MIVLRCTQRLLKTSGIEPVEVPSAPTAPLGEWYANSVSLPFRGRSLVVFVHGGTLLSVVAPGRVLGTTVPAFRRRLPDLLRRLELPRAWIDAQTAALTEVCFARTASRSVLGTMNEIARQIWWDAGSVRSFDQLDLDWLEARLGEVPFGALRYRSPIGALAELAQGTPAR